MSKKTKYVLHGGNAHHINPQNDKFLKEVLADTPNNTKILLVYFAKEDDRIPKNRDEDIAAFNRNKGDKNLTFETANDKDFTEQVKKADIVYLHGGNTLKLLNALKKFPKLKDLFEGKTIAGESAGAYVLSSWFYSKTANGVFEGLGSVAVKTICHYIGENSNKLDNLPTKVESLFMEDYQFKVFQQS